MAQGRVPFPTHDSFTTDTSVITEQIQSKLVPFESFCSD